MHLALLAGTLQAIQTHFPDCETGLVIATTVLLHMIARPLRPALFRSPANRIQTAIDVPRDLGADLVFDLLRTLVV